MWVWILNPGCSVCMQVPLPSEPTHSFFFLFFFHAVGFSQILGLKTLIRRSGWSGEGRITGWVFGGFEEGQCTKFKQQTFFFLFMTTSVLKYPIIYLLSCACTSMYTYARCARASAHTRVHIGNMKTISYGSVLSFHPGVGSGDWIHVARHVQQVHLPSAISLPTLVSF